MSVIQFTHPSHVSNIVDKEREEVSCRICKGLAFQPVMCRKCKSLYCRSHNQQFIGYRHEGCLCGSHLSERLDSKHISTLMNLKVTCDCGTQYNYSNYLAHKEECEKPRFKRFYVTFKDGSRRKMKDLDNMSINMNLQRNYIVYLKELKCMDEYYDPFSKSKECNETEREVIKLQFEEEPRPKTRPYWFYHADSNPYQPYSEQVQIQLQQWYQTYLQIPERERTDLESSGNKYIVDFKRWVQYRETTPAKTRAVHRVEI